MRIPTPAVLAGALLGGPLLAGAAAAPQDAAAPPILVRADRLIVRPGEVIENARVLVEDGRIVGVGTDLEAPDGALELEGEVVCAGFIDPWSALGIDPTDLAFRNASPASRTADSVDFWQHEAWRLEALRAGITAARVQAANAGPVAGLGAVVSLDPFASPEQALLSDAADLAMSIGLTRPDSGGAVFRQTADGSFVMEQSGPRPIDPFDRLAQADRVAASIESGRQYRENQVEYRYEHAEWEKKIAEREKELEKDFKKAKKDREKDKKKAEEKGKEFKEKRYKEDKEPKRPKYDADKEALAMAAEGEVPLVVEAHRAAEIRALLEGLEGQDRVRLVLAGATECLPFADELAERGVTVLLWPALHGVEAYDEFAGHDLALAGKLVAKGVHVLLGSGGRDPAQTRDLPLLVQYAIARGLDRDAAFEALTIGAARAFDLDREIGTVEYGKRADLQILDGEPLHTTTRVRYVICGGRLVVTPEG